MATDVEKEAIFSIDDWLGPDPSHEEVGREDLILEHLGYAYYCARRRWNKISLRHTGTFFDLDDFKSAATLGLIGAVDRFDPDMGWKFATFAVARINGAILDGLREIDPLFRKMRKYTKEVDKLTNTLGREPTRQELSKSMGVRISSIRRWEMETSRYSTMSLDEPILDNSWRSPGSGVVKLEKADLLDSGVDVEDLVVERMSLSEALQDLDGRYREMVCAYLMGMKQAEIGQRHGVTESRVCQVVKKFRQLVAA